MEVYYGGSSVKVSEGQIDLSVRPMRRIEDILAENLGEEKLSEVCRDLAVLLKNHGIHRSPDVCEVLFFYMADVVKGWNSV